MDSAAALLLTRIYPQSVTAATGACVKSGAATRGATFRPASATSPSGRATFSAAQRSTTPKQPVHITISSQQRPGRRGHQRRHGHPTLPLRQPLHRARPRRPRHRQCRRFHPEAKFSAQEVIATSAGSSVQGCVRAGSPPNATLDAPTPPPTFTPPPRDIQAASHAECTAYVVCRLPRRTHVTSRLPHCLQMCCAPSTSTPSATPSPEGSRCRSMPMRTPLCALPEPSPASPCAHSLARPSQHVRGGYA